MRRYLPLLLLLFCITPASAQQKGLKSISPEDIKFNLSFLASQEMRGRLTPSVELDIATKYLALAAARNGLKPLMPNGSFYQELMVESTTISPAHSRIRLGNQEFTFPDDFTVSNLRTAKAGKLSGAAVYVGLGVSAPDKDWDDYAGLDIKGKIVIMLDEQLPPNHALLAQAPQNPAAVPGARGPQSPISAQARSTTAFQKGAVAVITVLSPTREQNMAGKGLVFDILDRVRYPDLPVPIQNATIYTVTPEENFTTRYQVDLRHDAAARILGLDKTGLEEQFKSIREGRQVKARELSGLPMELTLGLNARRMPSYNVVGIVQGNDPVLKNEYVTITGHHDHLAYRNGEAYPGADDNASACVAMLELVKACVAEPPKRSVVFVWPTAEERGLSGALKFITSCPVPLEKISANLNLDMLARNDPNGIYLVGVNTLSSELLENLEKANDPSLNLKLDSKTYEDPAERNRFFFRSDHYPHVLAGIPGVWIFSGTTPDYHTTKDTFENADLGKIDRVTRFAYLAALRIGNQPALLKLDKHPDVKTRGLHNQTVPWKQPAPSPQTKK